VIEIPVRLLRPEAVMPARAYEHDAAFDLCAATSAIVAPSERAVVPTGIALGLPADVCALTLPRSGLAARHGITIVNAPGLIDPGYRGEVCIILLNTDSEQAFAVSPGDRIAQLLFVTLTGVSLIATQHLDVTARGERGFGSSGIVSGSSGDRADVEST
jgi:dUTP pyrophosphatase